MGSGYIPAYPPGQVGVAQVTLPFQGTSSRCEVDLVLLDCHRPGSFPRARTRAKPRISRGIVDLLAFGLICMVSVGINIHTVMNDMAKVG